jgi:phosphatidate cytidylyltransferase
MSKILQRVVTAIILIAVLLVVFFALPGEAAVVLIAAFVAAGAWEWAGFAGPSSTGARALYTGLVILCVLGVLGLRIAGLPTAWLVWAGMVWWGLAFILVLRFPLKISALTTAICGFLVLLPVWAACLALLASPAAGPALLLFALAVVWAADVGAYFAGRRFGRVKLAPAVSPGKTWEGVLGGLLAALLVAWCGSWLLGMSSGLMLPVALSLALISVLGDLTVSLFKRNAGLKDSGSLFPGHGGVLDRVDGVSSAVPLFALQMQWSGLVTF